MTDLPESEAQEAADLRSYGRRRGRKLSPRQERLLRELLPRRAVDLAKAPPGSPLEVFQAPDGGAHGKAVLRQLWLEIGFGGGEHLVWQAERNPDVGLIGCEPFEEGVVKVLTAIDERGLPNIRLHPDDARELLRWLPAGSIDRAFILFPDPWPKVRHRKRRLVNPATLAVLARVLKPGAELRVATDIGDYLRTMLIAFAGCPDLVWQARSPEDWRVRPADWPETRYEAKAAREGRRRYYLSFRRA